MFKLSLQTVSCLSLLAAAVAVSAQTAKTPNPTGVAVTPQTAAEAQQNAVPRNDTGTVVRTGPTAAERSRDAANAGTDAARAAVGGSTPAVSNADTGAAASPDAATTRRAARADRN